MTGVLLRRWFAILAVGVLGGLLSDAPHCAGSKASRRTPKGAKPKSPAAAAPAERIAARPTIDVSLIPGDAAVGIVMHPRRMLSAPEMKFLPIEVYTALGQSEFGIDPLNIEQLVIIGKAPSGPGEGPQVAFIVRFAKAPKPGTLLAKLMEDTEKATLAGKAYRKARDPNGVSLYLSDPQTLIVAGDAFLQQMVTGKNGTGHVAKLLQQADLANQVVAVVSIDTLRDLIKMGLALFPPLPEPLQKLTEAPDHIAAVELHANMSGLPGGKIRSSLVFHGAGANGAVETEKLLTGGLSMGKQMLLARLEQNKPPGNDPVREAQLQYAIRIIDAAFDNIQPVRNNDRVTIGIEVDGNMAAFGALAALSLRAVDEAPMLQSAHTTAKITSINNLKMIGLAMHNHHDAKRGFAPRASIGKDGKEGKPLLSWRVHILPFIEEYHLYQQFHLDEPWDSEHNIKLVDKMPAIYASPSRKVRDGKTVYLMPVGKGTLFEDGEKVNFGTITDGSSKTIMVVEADSDRAVTWTAPEDLAVDADDPAKGLGHIRSRNGFAALFADGHVAMLDDIDPKILMALFTSKGGEIISEGNY